MARKSLLIGGLVALLLGLAAVASAGVSDPAEGPGYPGMMGDPWVEPPGGGSWERMPEWMEQMHGGAAPWDEDPGDRMREWMGWMHGDDPGGRHWWEQMPTWMEQMWGDRPGLCPAHRYPSGPPPAG